MSAGQIKFGLEAGVATLQICRPERRNAMSKSMWAEALAHLDSAVQSSDVRGLVVTGSGGAFCAGADLGDSSEDDEKLSRGLKEVALSTYAAIAAFPAPTLAQIDGPCIGGGVSLALACDMRFASQSATFAVPSVKHGIVYNVESVNKLRSLVGSGATSYLLYTGSRVDAPAAARMGLVDACVEDLAGFVAQVTEAIVSGDPRAIAATRSLIRGAAHPPV